MKGYDLSRDINRLNEWQKRIIQEKVELDEKIRRMRDFFSIHNEEFENSDRQKLQLMIMQLQCMVEYSTLLMVRIEGFYAE